MDDIRLIEQLFPLEEISEACAEEKSVRQGHISTLQQWWARRPLAVCRSAIFATLCSPVSTIEKSPVLVELLDQYGKPDDDIRTKLSSFTAQLAYWENVNDRDLLQAANKLIMASRESAPLVVDTFAGGGSLPIEALRLGLCAFASELNPVAILALRVAIEKLPGTDNEVLNLYKESAFEIQRRIHTAISRLYGTKSDEAPLAFFWCRTYQCPECNVEVPLLHDFWLAKGKRKVAVKLERFSTFMRFSFNVYSPAPDEEAKISIGTVKQTGAICPACDTKVSTKWLRQQGMEKLLGERLYAKLIKDKSGRRVYKVVNAKDEQLAKQAALRKIRNRKHKIVPSEHFDKNGIRHTWAIQYGVETTSDLYNNRQGVALLELLQELEKTKQTLLRKTRTADQALLVIMLLALTFNRLVVYGNRHAWWQSNGEFPANMFGRQAIPMVWNYVEIPINSEGAAGWNSAQNWISKIAIELAKLPQRGRVMQGDAANCSVLSRSADLVAIDPPYYDSIAYSYLSDIFYVWMRAFLRDLLPDDFVTALSPKAEEAIVDRQHSLAPNPKSDGHFRKKMFQALLEAKRILKPNGRLLIMFGHKKVEAWDAMLSAVIDAGFIPSVSWPVHTERKVKFRHAHIDALSSSCLMICVPNNKTTKQSISWTDFVEKLKVVLLKSIRHFQTSQLYGADLTTSLIAPACTLFREFEVRTDGEGHLTIGTLLSRLPTIVAECEYKDIMSYPSTKKYPNVLKAIKTLSPHTISTKSGPLNVKRSWLMLGSEHSLIMGAVKHANLLFSGKQKEADRIWEELSTEEKEVFCQLLRAAALASGVNTQERQLAQASLGRISLQMRTSDS
ncbi:MAG: putative methylase [Acidobacteriota bacterium]|nr:putative methylase [Acidobacteriota bacterium]